MERKESSELKEEGENYIKINNKKKSSSSSSSDDSEKNN
jgi:hypothetical protein